MIGESHNRLFCVKKNIQLLNRAGNALYSRAFARGEMFILRADSTEEVVLALKKNGDIALRNATAQEMSRYEHVCLV